MSTSSALLPTFSSEQVGAATTPDPLGFLAGRHYTCYCGKSVEGTMLCRACAEEMVARLSRHSRAPDGEFTKIG
jgi:hypothetical protein